jgi:hypothetical protein
MADENPTDCAERNPSDSPTRDERDQRVVLAFVLDEHPDQLTIPELCRALYAHPGDFVSDDAVERAIRDLDGAGLLSCAGGIVRPTRAALCFARLDVAP